MRQNQFTDVNPTMKSKNRWSRSYLLGIIQTDSISTCKVTAIQCVNVAALSFVHCELNMPHCLVLPSFIFITKGCDFALANIQIQIKDLKLKLNVKYKFILIKDLKLKMKNIILIMYQLAIKNGRMQLMLFKQLSKYKQSVL